MLVMWQNRYSYDEAQLESSDAERRSGLMFNFIDLFTADDVFMNTSTFTELIFWDSGRWNGGWTRSGNRSRTFSVYLILKEQN